MKTIPGIISRLFATGILFFVCLNAYAFNLESLSQGQEAFNAGDYEKALQLWRNLALQGNTKAQVFTGLAYANGWGVKKDMQQAAMWYHIAAENNDPSAQFLLGLHYIASANDALFEVGVMWLQKASKNGDLSANRFLEKAKLRGWLQVPEQSVIGQHSIVNESDEKPKNGPG